MKSLMVEALRAILDHKTFRAVWGLLSVASALAAGGTAAYVAAGISKSPGIHSSDGAPAGHEQAQAAKVKRDGLDAVVVPTDTATKMGLQTGTAALPSGPMRLPALQGVLAFDNDRLSRVRSRFAGEVVDIGRPGASESIPCFQVGDSVRAGDLLAVVWSKDLGEKKSELVDALSKLKLDRDSLVRYQSLTEGVIALKQVREAEAAVRASEIAVAKAEQTLRAWRVSEDEIQALIAHANEVGSAGARREAAKDQTWAKVEVRSPRDGVILEKNVAIGDIVDTTADLFKIGDVSQLTVWAHVYEEDLALLQSLPRPIRWTVTVQSQPGVAFPGTLTRIAAVIDPAQHTALVSGPVENPTRSLKAGQFVTIAVELPAPTDELALPAAAVVEDGRESMVFVQPDANEFRFVRRSVNVLRRFRDMIYIRADENGPQSGSRVVTAGALLLRDAMESLETRRVSEG